MQFEFIPRAGAVLLCVLAIVLVGCRCESSSDRGTEGQAKVREIDTNQRLKATLDRMHDESDGEFLTILGGLWKGIFRPLKPEDLEDAYIAVDRDQGVYIYDLALEHEARNVVEFGTSFGISTLYLAAAAKQTDGRVITAEILPEKVKVARANFEEAGMLRYIDLREGDAMDTLKNVPDRIDFLFFDAWSELYVPLLEQLEPKMKDGAILVTDNTNFAGTKKFVKFLREHPNYDSRPAPVANTEVTVYRKVR